MNPADHLDDHPRVRVLSERFREIDVSMRDLPIYNPTVTIEAIGFRPFGADALLGVLVTPWFMNLTLLPVERVPMDMAAIGRTVLVELPAGSRTFAVNGDDVTGLYKAYSLYSPMGTFQLPRPGRRGGAPDAGIADDASNSGTQRRLVPAPATSTAARCCSAAGTRQGRTTRSSATPLGNRSSNRFACTRPSPIGRLAVASLSTTRTAGIAGALPAQPLARIPHILSQVFPLCGTAHAVAGLTAIEAAFRCEASPAQRAFRALVLLAEQAAASAWRTMMDLRPSWANRRRSAPTPRSAVPPLPYAPSQGTTRGNKSAAPSCG